MQDDTLAKALAQLEEVRTALAEQQRLNARQQTAIESLERRMEWSERAHAVQRPLDSALEAAEPVAQVSYTASVNGGKRGTSRRGLLRGAATATAAAAVATVAVSGAQQAHAAPNATGGTLILGQYNDANSTTVLAQTGGTMSANMLEIDAGEGFVVGIASFTADGEAISGTDLRGGRGVTAQSNSGVGLAGISNSDVAIYAYGTGRIAQTLQSAAGAPTGTSTSYNSGEQIRDSNGELWLCIGAGAPGTWVLVSHAQVGYLGGVTNYLSKPIRLLDTRVGQPPNSAHQQPGAPVTAGSPFTVTVASVTFNSVSVPASAVGAIGNVTVVADQGDGSYLEVVPSGAGFTGAANLAYAPGQTVSNAFNVGLGSGNLDIILGSGSADVIVDLFAFVS